MIMKEQNKKATNLQVGRIYINANTGEPCRLITILACEGVWLENAFGDGYGDTVAFEDVFYASEDEVQDFLDDHRVWNSHTDAPSHKSVREYDTPREYAYGKEIVRDSDGSAVIGWYDDNDGNDIRCRD